MRFWAQMAACTKMTGSWSKAIFEDVGLSAMTSGSKGLESTHLWPQMETRSSADKYSTKKAIRTGAVLMTSFSFKCYCVIWKDWKRGQRMTCCRRALWSPALIAEEKSRKNPISLQALCSEALSDGRKQSLRGEVHEHTLPSAPLQPFQRAPPTPPVTRHSSTSWQMSRGSRNDRSILLLLFTNQPGLQLMSAKGRFAQLLVCLRS